MDPGDRLPSASGNGQARRGTYTGRWQPPPHGPDRPGTAPRIGARAVLVPVKAFDQAKRRLHLALSGPERADLSRAMADRVLTAAHPLPVAVVCDDNDVAEWARRRGALVIWEPGRGLNGAVEAGVDHLAVPRRQPR